MEKSLVMTKLTNQKREKAAQVFVETGNKTEAYRKAGYSTNMNDKAIHRAALRLFENVHVLSRVTELQSKHQKRHEITVDSLTNQLLNIHQLALESNNLNAAVSSINSIARIHGLDVKEVNVNIDINLSLIHI